MTPQQQEYEALSAHNQKMKKRFLVILFVALGVLVLLIAVTVVLKMIFPETALGTDLEIVFSDPYEGDIFQYEAYLATDRKIYYHDGMIIRSVEEDRLEEFDTCVLFLCEFVKTMESGDVAAYNSSFTVDPQQAEFSQQMIYETVIFYQQSAKQSNGDVLYTYTLEYKLLRNDGSLRRDVGSRSVRPLFVTLRLHADGSVTIDQLYSDYQVFHKAG